MTCSLTAPATCTSVAPMATGTSVITGSGHNPATWIAQLPRSHEHLIRILAHQLGIRLARDHRNPATPAVPRHGRSWREITAPVSKAHSEHRTTIDNAVVAAVDDGVELSASTLALTVATGRQPGMKGFPSSTWSGSNPVKPSNARVENFTPPDPRPVRMTRPIGN